MTIIAVKDGVMCADSEMDAGSRSYPVMRPKIARGPGGLAGATGYSSDCVAFCDWFAAGEDPEQRPAFAGTGDDELQALVLRPGGTVWRIGAKELPFQIPATYAIGGGYAWAFCEGLMVGGKSCEKAVKLTIKHFRSVGGKVQVERL